MRRSVLDLLASRRSKDLDSLREQVVPWLIKTAWQKGLTQRYTSSKLREPLVHESLKLNSQSSTRPVAIH